MGRVKSIIMDVAPSGDNLKMAADLGYDQGALDQLAAAVNAEFGSNITGAELAPFQTVSETVTFIQSHIP